MQRIPPHLWLWCDADQFVEWLDAGLLQTDSLALISNRYAAHHSRWRKTRERILNLLMDGDDEAVSSRDVARALHCSLDSATARLTELVEAGVLVETLPARGNHPRFVTLADDWYERWAEHDAAKVREREQQ